MIYSATLGPSPVFAKLGPPPPVGAGIGRCATMAVRSASMRAPPVDSVQNGQSGFDLPRCLRGRTNSGSPNTGRCAARGQDTFARSVYPPRCGNLRIRVSMRSSRGGGCLFIGLAPSRPLLVFCDMGARGAVVRGTCAAAFRRALSEALWLAAASRGVSIWVAYVRATLNPPGRPSRMCLLSAKPALPDGADVGIPMLFFDIAESQGPFIRAQLACPASNLSMCEECPCTPRRAPPPPPPHPPHPRKRIPDALNSQKTFTGESCQTLRKNSYWIRRLAWELFGVPLESVDNAQCPRRLHGFGRHAGPRVTKTRTRDRRRKLGAERIGARFRDIGKQTGRPDIRAIRGG